MVRPSKKGPAEEGHSRGYKEPSPTENVSGSTVQTVTRRAGQVAVYPQRTEKGQS